MPYIKSIEDLSTNLHTKNLENSTARSRDENIERKENKS